jgi:hypothetical protein
MVLVATLIAVEKLLQWKAVANRSIAIPLAVLGLGVAFVPPEVPGLTVPSAKGGTPMQDGSMEPSRD